MKEIKSVLEQVSQKVFIMKNPNEAKILIVNFISETKIKDIDKKRIIEKVQALKSMYQIQYYMCNSLLQYEGLGLNGHSPKEEKPLHDAAD